MGGKMDLMAELINRFEPIISKIIDPLIVILWRLGLGRLFNLWPVITGRIMVIKHYDMKNGTPAFTPVNFLEQETVLYFVPRQRADFNISQNIMANPQVEVWLPDGWYTGQADLVATTPERLLLLQKIFSESPIIARISGVTPLIDESEFESTVVDYPVFRVIRQSPRTGVNGPGGLAWLWPFILLFLLGLRPRRRR